MEGSLVAYKVFTNGSTLQASELNENLMQQSTAVFSNAAARTAAIVSPLEGQLTYLEDVDRYDSYNGAAWVPAFGLSLIKRVTIGTSVSSVTVSDVFSSTFDAYKIIVSGGSSTILNTNLSYLSIQLGAASTGHNSSLIFAPWAAGSVSNAGFVNQSAFPYSGAVTTDSLHADVTLVNPFLTSPTYGTSFFSDPTNAGPVQFRHTASTSFTAFTLSRPAGAGVMTGGNIAVYGYRKS
jgi:hypothetical protein